MKPDNNWINTRVITKDLETILGVPVHLSEDYLITIENLIIHKFIEVSMDQDAEDYQIELPYLGSLVISPLPHHKLSVEFTPRKSFYNKLCKAYYDKESPLIIQCAKALGGTLSNKFEEGDGNE